MQYRWALRAVRVVTLAGAAGLALLTLPAQAEEPLPDSATIRERSSAAVGAEPPNYHEVVTYTTPSSSGKTETFQRGSDYRVIDDEGPLHTESGMVGGERWHQNANGHTVMEYDDRAAPGREERTTTVRRVTTPVDAYLVTRLTKGGYGTREYFDPTTYYPIRRENVQPSGTIVYEYGAFKAFAKRHLASHWTRLDVASKELTTFDRTVFTDDDPGADAVALRPNRRRLVEFPESVGTVDLAARLTEDDQWIVRVMIGDRGLDFTLDTGASDIAIDGGVAKQLGLQLVNPSVNASNAGRYASGSVIVPEMRVGDLTLHGAVVDIAPLAFDVGDAVKSVGLLGFDFLAESQFTLDYEHKRITVTRYEDARPPSDPRTQMLPIRLNSEQPYVTTTVNGVTTDRMIFDTGAAGSMMFFDSFTRRHPDALPERDRRAGSQEFFGVGGAFKTAPYLVPHLLVGRFDFTDFIAYKTISAAVYDTSDDGVLGPDFFRIFTVGLDYPNGRIFLTPNRSFNAVPER